MASTLPSSPSGFVEAPSTPSASVLWARLTLLFTVLGAITGVLFFSVGGVFALLSDLAALGIGISMAMLMVVLRPAIARTGAREALVSATGLLGAGLAILGSTILCVTYFGPFAGAGGPGLTMQFVGFPLQGAWLTAVAVLSLRGAMLDRTTGWFGLVAGLGYMSFVVAIVAGPQHVVAMSGGSLGLLAMIGWLVRLQRRPTTAHA